MGSFSGKETVDTVHVALEAPFGETRELPRYIPDIHMQATVPKDVGPLHEQAPAANTMPCGTTIGRFVVLDVVGTGAAGVVCKAYDPTLGREVALKLLQSGSLGKEAQARLLDEARAMARISHPNVVTVHEVSVEAEQVVLAMEYVSGSTLWDWAREQPRPWRAIVAAYRQAGAGLAAAHRAGLVHRDFKPANVLVGDDGRILVTDFGIATNLADFARTPDPGGDAQPRAIENTRADAVAGTPWYMAPEQHRGGDVDERCDQYAFCLALWEALCGDSPFKGTTAAELAKAKSMGVPAWPKHVPVPSSVVGAIRRGLGPDPESRFGHMDELLERLAYDPATHRRRWLAAMTIVPACAISGGWAWAWQAERSQVCSGGTEHLEGIWDGDRRINLERALAATGSPHASRTGTHVVHMLDDYARAWTSQFTETCESTAVRAEQSQATMELRMACLHRSKLELRATVNLLGQADAQVVEKAATMAAELPSLQRCQDLHAVSVDAAPSEPPEETAQLDEVRTLLADAQALRRAAKFEEALARVVDAGAVLGDGGKPSHLSMRSEIAFMRGEIEGALGRYAEAEATLREALRIALRSGAAEQGSKIASTLARGLAAWQRRPAEGQWLAEIALELALEREDVFAEAHARTSLGLVSRQQGRQAQGETEIRRAIELWDKALGPNNLPSTHARNTLATGFEEQGRFVEAEEQHRQVLAIIQQTLGPEHPEVAQSHNNLGVVKAQQGRSQEAIEHFRHAIELYENALGPEHPALVMSMANLASVFLFLERHDEAQNVLRRAIVIAQKKLGPQHATVIQLKGNLAVVHLGQKRYEEADEQLHQALVAMEASLGASHPDVAAILDNLGLSALRQGKLEEATSVLRRALSIQEAALPEDHPVLARGRMLLAKALTQQSHTQEARQLLEQAWESVADAAVRPEHRAEIAFELGQLLGTHERQRAVELAHAALAGYREAGAPRIEEVAEVERWLAATSPSVRTAKAGARVR